MRSTRKNTTLLLKLYETGKFDWPIYQTTTPLFEMYTLHKEQLRSPNQPQTPPQPAASQPKVHLPPKTAALRPNPHPQLRP